MTTDYRDQLAARDAEIARLKADAERVDKAFSAAVKSNERLKLQLAGAGRAQWAAEDAAREQQARRDRLLRAIAGNDATLNSVAVTILTHIGPFQHLDERFTYETDLTKTIIISDALDAALRAALGEKTQ